MRYCKATRLSPLYHLGNSIFLERQLMKVFTWNLNLKYSDDFEAWITNVFSNLAHSHRHAYSRLGIIFKLIDFNKYDTSFSFHLFFITYQIQRFYGKVLYMEFLHWWFSGKKGSMTWVQDTHLANISLKMYLNHLLSDISRAVGGNNPLISVSSVCNCSAFLKIPAITYDLPF